MEEINKLLEVIYKLRNKENGCPWDLQQTHQSLKKYLIEECFEFFDALDEKDFEAVKDEAGDVLFNLMLQCNIAEEENHFSFKDVVENITQKMIRRHPHIFADSKAKSLQELEEQWQRIKQEENIGQKNELQKISTSLPNLMRSQKLQQKKRATELENLYKNLTENINQLKNNSSEEETISKILFDLCHVANHKEINLELLLHQANDKFIKDNI